MPAAPPCEASACSENVSSAGCEEERINGCMERSMNGRALPLNGAEMKAMLSYLKFLSTGIAVGTQLESAGTMKLKLLG
jgi:cytochrome c